MTAQSSSVRSRIDWREVKERLAQAQAALAASEQLSSHQAKVIMDARARLLTRVPDRAPEASEVLEVLTWRLGDQKFALETQYVCEVHRPDDITPLPGSPSFLVGVANLRGEVLAVLDLRELFGMPAAEANERRLVVIVGGGRPEFGIVAEEVCDVVALRICEVLEPPGSVVGISRDCLRGVTEDALLVLDGHALLTDQRLYMDDGIVP